MEKIDLSKIPPITDEEEAEIQREIADDPDAPEATDEELALGRPFAEVFPDLMASIKRDRAAELAARNRSDADAAKKKILESVRFITHNPEQDIAVTISSDVMEKLRSFGSGWQDRVDDILRKAVGL